MKTIYLVRHGDYDYKDKNSETEGQGLLTIGVEQAQATAYYFKQLNKLFSAIHCSDFLRTIQTAEIIAKKLSTPEQKPTFQTWEELQECADIYYQDFPDAIYPAVTAFHRHFTHNNSTGNVYEIIVCHANLIRYFVSKIQGWTREEWERTLISNCSITEIVITDSGICHVNNFANDDHLPIDLREIMYDFL
jgi:serine/threonine-protein phosphatase PGAM5